MTSPGGGIGAEAADMTPKQPVEAPNIKAQAPPAEPAAEPAAGASGLTPDEERQLGDLQAKKQAATAAGGSVRLKVEAPHAELIFGGVKIGTDFTEVPEHQAPAITQAAADAGVTITQEESES